MWAARYHEHIQRPLHRVNRLSFGSPSYLNAQYWPKWTHIGPLCCTKPLCRISKKKRDCSTILRRSLRSHQQPCMDRRSIFHYSTYLGRFLCRYQYFANTHSCLRGHLEFFHKINLAPKAHSVWKMFFTDLKWLSFCHQEAPAHCSLSCSKTKKTPNSYQSLNMGLYFYQKCGLLDFWLNSLLPTR